LLDYIRLNLQVDTVILELKQALFLSKPNYIAMGARSGPDDLHVWRDRPSDPVIDQNFPQGTVRMFNSLQQAGFQNALMSLAKEFNIRRGMSVAIGRNNNVDYFLRLVRTTDRSAPFGPAEIDVAKFIAPHLGKALRLRAQSLSNMWERQLYSGLLARLGTGLLICAPNMSCRAASPSTEKLLAECGLLINNGRLRSRDARLTAQLKAAVASAATDPDAQFERGIYLGNGKLALVHCIRDPIPQNGCDPNEAMILLYDSATSFPPEKIKILSEVFGFTATESKIAMHMLNGQDTNMIRNMLSIKYTTLRSHVSSMFVKVDCNRQSELVRRLSLALPIMASTEPPPTDEVSPDARFFLQ